MMGSFGLFAAGELVAEFGDDETADEYRRKTVLQEDLPEHLRTTEYDADDLKIRCLDDAEEACVAAARV